MLAVAVAQLPVASTFTPARLKFRLHRDFVPVDASSFRRCSPPRATASGPTVLKPVLTAAAAAPLLAPPSPQPTLKQWAVTESAAIAPIMAFYIMHSLLRKVLLALGVAFPASIVGMLSGFGMLCAIRKWWSADAADGLEAFFAPACRLFRAWLAAIFAPGLITLPLVMPSLPPTELAVFVGLIGGGFVASTATGVLAARLLAPRGGGRLTGGLAGGLTGKVVPTAPAAAPPAPPADVYVPFPRSQRRFFLLSALVCLGAHLASGSALLLNLGLLATTLGTFAVASVKTPAAVQVYLHPFLQCSAATLLACAGVGALGGLGWKGVLASYASPAGAGGWLTLLLGPCVVSFALQLYSYREALMSRARQIVGTAVLSTFVSMLASAAAARLCGIAPVLRLALFSRTTTTALTAEVGRLLGVAPAFGVLAAFITAILAFATGKPLLAKLGVTDPVTRGLALSSAAHGGAVVTMSDEPEAFPFAVLMMNLSAAAAVVLLSLRPVRTLLLVVAGCPAT